MLPVSNPTASYWRGEPHWLDQHRSTEQLPTQADIVIIGAGIAGVSTVYHLVNRHRGDNAPQPSILLLEARQVCSGATGRNGGHIKKLPSTIQELIDYHGNADAGEIIEFVRSNIYSVKGVIEQEGIEADAELRRSFDVSLTKDDADTVQQNFQKQLRTGFPLTEDIGYVGEKFAERITSIHGAKAGLSTPVLSLWPYKFVTQLLERAMAKGNINLQTNTPVTAIDPGSEYTVHTPRGSVRTPVVVHATNGYAAGLLSQYDGVITPAKATASHIAVPQGNRVPYLSNTYNIRYTSSRVDYLNPRPDGGIVVGGGKWTYQGDRRLWYNNYDDSTLIEPARHYFDGLMQHNFRGWEESGAFTDSVWTGIQGITHDGMPHVGKVPGTVGQFVLAGYNGGGMALAFMAAQGVARMINEGIEFEETGIPRVMKTTEPRLKLHNPAC
ncbi:FAD dependent oxidoreductase [Aspergillus venezuelensis]